MYRGMSLRVGVLIVALLVGSGAAFAAPLPQGEHPRAEAQSPLAQAWHWMTSLFDTALAAVQGDPLVSGVGSGGGVEALSDTGQGGMAIDPNGGW